MESMRKGQTEKFNNTQRKPEKMCHEPDEKKAKMKIEYRRR